MLALAQAPAPQPVLLLRSPDPQPARLARPASPLPLGLTSELMTARPSSAQGDFSGDFGIDFNR